MAELFIRAFLGHLVGDYLLQSTRIALDKSRRDLVGWSACSFHVCLYTAAVCFAIGTNRILIVVLIFFLLRAPLADRSLQVRRAVVRFDRGTHDQEDLEDANRDRARLRRRLLRTRLHHRGQHLASPMPVVHPTVFQSFEILAEKAQAWTCNCLVNSRFPVRGRVSAPNFSAGSSIWESTRFGSEGLQVQFLPG